MTSLYTLHLQKPSYLLRILHLNMVDLKARLYETILK